MGAIQHTQGRGAILPGFVVLWLCLAFAAPAVAQNYDNPGLGELPVVAHPQDYKPLGIRAGGFMLHPGIQLAAEWNDNVFYTNENAESGVRDDLIMHYRPYVTAQSNWSQHAFNVRLAADVARHQDYGYRDYEDYFLLIGGRVDVRNRSYMSYSLDYMDLHEGLNSRDAEQGLEPTRYSLYGGSIGYDHTFNRLSLGIIYSLRRMDFDDVVDPDGSVIDNQDRDRDESSLGLRAGYQFQTEKQAFVSLTTRAADYKQVLDRNEYARSNDGWSADAGLLFTITGKLDGDVFASYHERSYDDPNLPDVSGWAAGAGLRWRPTRLTSVGARISSDIQETTYKYSSGYLRTLYSVRANHELTRFLQLSGQVSYSDNDYQLIPGAPADARTEDKIWQAGVGLNYFVNRNIFLSLSYTYDHLTSNVVDDDYDVNRVWATLSLEY